jgi:hypothetical protein
LNRIGDLRKRYKSAPFDVSTYIVHMSNQKRTLTVLVVAIAALAVAGVGFGMVSGQILSEETYYEEEFENLSHINPEDYALEEMDEAYYIGAWDNGRDSYRNRHRAYSEVNRLSPGGERMWKNNLANHRGNMYVEGMALIDEGSKLAALDRRHSRLHLVESSTGDPIWELSTGANHLRATSDGKLVTIDRSNRFEVWETEVNESTGVPDQLVDVNFDYNPRFTKIHPDGDKLFYGGQAGAGMINISDGETLWHIEQSDPTSDVDGTVTAGAVEPNSGNVFFYDHGAETFKELNVNGELVATYEDSSGGSHRTMHIGPRGYIYSHSDNGEVHKFSQTFSEEWAIDVGDAPRSYADTLTVTANQKVMTGDDTGDFYKIDGETGDIEWTWNSGRDGWQSSAALHSLNENWGFPNYEGQPDTIDASEFDSISGYSGPAYETGFWSSQGEKTLSATGDITKTFSESAITEDGVRNVYVIATIETGDQPVDASINQFGQEVGSGSISGNSRSEMTVEFSPQTHEFDYTLSSDTAFEIVDLKLVTLQETTEGDPLSAEGPVVLDADQGYDRTVGVLVSALDISTTHLLIIIMIALVVGFMVFTYTKSVRGQELAQSLLFGAIIAGIVIIGVVPTFNLASWVFTGDIDRAPLANPALEAEPPTYYSTEFQDGTMNGWEFDYQRSSGEARPVSVGDSFNLDFSGTPTDAGAVRHDEHISLGNALDTGFVDVRGIASGQSGLVGPVHETTLNMRVYVTEDGNLESSDMLDPSTNYVRQEGDNIDTFVQNHEHAVAVEEVALSFNGEVVTNDHMVTFPLEGEYVHVELVASDNRDDVAAEAQLAHVRIGATVEGIGEQGE